MTIEKHIRDFLVFSVYTDGAEIAKELAVAYKNKLKNDGYSVRSISSILASINCLFAFLGWHDLKVKSIKVQQQIFCAEEKELTKTEYMRLVNTTRIYIISTGTEHRQRMKSY